MNSSPSSSELEQAAATLDQIAASAKTTMLRVGDFSPRLAALGNRVEALVAGTATRIDASMIGQLSSTADDVRRAVDSLQATQRAAERAADAARAQAEQAKRREQAEREQAPRRR